ncbi:MAG: signal peptidase II [Rickettsiales bacterium]
MYKKQKKSWKNNIIYIVFVVLLFAADQFSKVYFIQFFENNPAPEVMVNDFLNFVYLWNKGISFGMFNNWEYSNLIFITVATVITWYFMLLYFKESNLSIKISYGFIIGGALGNITDRIKYNAVYDFIDFHFREYHWPAFNLADAFITIGGFLLLLSLFSSRVKKNEANKI